MVAMRSNAVGLQANYETAMERPALRRAWRIMDASGWGAGEQRQWRPSGRNWALENPQDRLIAVRKIPDIMLAHAHSKILYPFE